MSETAHNLPIRKALLLTTVVTAGIALCVNAARDAMPKRSDAEVAAMRTIIARASYTEGLYCDGEHYSPLR
ncbi:MAG: hypothetical protein WAO98_10420, partial [Alphaproteobacteria bacterium]